MMLLATLFLSIQARFPRSLSAEEVIRVPEDYSTIQGAIDAAPTGSVILVSAGVYNENITIDKPLNLTGEDKKTTVINGGGTSESVVLIEANDVSLQGLTVVNSSQSSDTGGIFLVNSSRCKIKETIIIHNSPGGISLWNSHDNSIEGNLIAFSGAILPGWIWGWNVGLIEADNNTVVGNILSDSVVDGISLEKSNGTTVSSNVIQNSDEGISLWYSNDSIVDHNAFLNVRNFLFMYNAYNSTWSRLQEGNYWDDYVGLDDGSGGRIAGDGIGDTDLPHLGVDNYPLVRPQFPMPVLVENATYNLSLNGNSTISAPRVYLGNKTIALNLTGPMGTAGNSNVTVDKGMFGYSVWKDKWHIVPWKIMLNDTDITKQTRVEENQTHACFTFSYDHGFSHVQITQTLLRVPQDYSTIQSAVNTASSEGTVVVGNGTYHEQIFIYGPLNLFGDSNLSTIIDADGSGNGIRVANAKVVIDGFTVRNSSIGIYFCPSSNSRISNSIILDSALNGIQLETSNSNLITGNLLVHSSIELIASNNNTIDNNIVSDSLENGIVLSGSGNNVVRSNVIENSQNLGIDARLAQDNAIYLNAFVNNHEAQAAFSAFDPNFWSEGGIGNYWDDYVGTDDGNNNRTAGDGIGDTGIPHLGIDECPLVRPPFPIPVVIENTPWPIEFESNSTVAGFRFSQTNKTISINVTGPAGTTGYCNTTIPRSFMLGEPWTVKLNSTNVTSTSVIAETNESTLVHMKYDHSGISNIQIVGTWVVPEFSPKIILTLILLSSTVMIILRKSRKTRVDKRLTADIIETL